MIIIFEGVDRTGKTTQIKTLKNKLKQKFIVKKCEKPPKYIKNKYLWAKNYYKNLMKLITTRKNINIIFDRSYIGEYVYSPLYRNYEGEYVFQLEKVFKINRLHNIHLIVLIDEINNLNKRDDGKNLAKNDEYKLKEINLFKEAFKKSIIHNKLLLNIANKSIEKVNEIICNFLKQGGIQYENNI